jgi:hypothetical protein
VSPTRALEPPSFSARVSVRLHVLQGRNNVGRLIFFKSDGQGCQIPFRVLAHADRRGPQPVPIFSSRPQWDALLGWPALSRSAQQASCPPRFFRSFVLTFV